MIKLNLGKNELTHLSLGENNSLTQLHLNNNRLNNLDVEENRKLELISIYENDLKDVPNLPESVRVLKVDGNIVQDYDFKALVNLK